MKRRESLKILGIGTLAAPTLLNACTSEPKAPGDVKATKNAIAGRQEFEIERDKRLKSETFFSDHELATITVLANLIIPKDDRSGSASDAEVPDFIEFIVKDIPEHQTPMRGGLRWLDVQCLNRYKAPFKDCDSGEQLDMLNDIAFPGKVKPGMQPGVAFFNRLRDLTANGFFTSEMGIKDLGYVGNVPNQWPGVPPEVLKQYGLEKYGES